jgi:predicted acetyltransferase
MIVVSLNQTHRDVFKRMLDDYEAHDPINGEWYAKGRDDFEAYAQSLENDEKGINLPVGIVPCSHRWLLDDQDNIVGIVRIRHNIDTPFLTNEGGHIGYDVPPSQRGKRYGIASLNAGLQVAKELQITKVLLTADDLNPSSWRTIERCGGILERTFLSEFYNCQVRRYWIDL